MRRRERSPTGVATPPAVAERGELGVLLSASASGVFVDPVKRVGVAPHYSAYRMADRKRFAVSFRMSLMPKVVPDDRGHVACDSSRVMGAGVVVCNGPCRVAQRYRACVK